MLRPKRWRRFVVSALAATLSVLALSQTGRAADYICINNQCGPMVAVNMAQQMPPIEAPISQPPSQQSPDEELQAYEPDPEVQWIAPPVEQPPPAAQIPADCGVTFGADIRSEQRQSICNLIAKNPDLAGTIDAVTYNSTPIDAHGMGEAWASTLEGHVELRRAAMNGNLSDSSSQFYLAHEAAHRKSEKIFGSSDPPPASEVSQAMEAEKAGLRPYSYVDKSEQFADLYAAAVVGDPRLDQFPRTKAAIERMRAGGAG